MASCSSDDAPNSSGPAVEDDDAGADASASTSPGEAPVVAGTSVRSSIVDDRATASASDPAIGSQSSGGAGGGDTVVVSIEPVPETGVPGIDSTDRFCRAWSEFAGSFQALATATASGRDRTQIAAVEVAAAPVMAEAVAVMAAQLPEELEPEREQLVEQYVGPLGRRSERVVELAQAASVADAELQQLGQRWLDALIAGGVSDPDIEVPLDGLDAVAITAAADDVAASLPSLFEDPSLIVDVAIPRTVDFLTTRCPDQGVLGGLDIIGP